jgi:tetratricopeptide (TPR) repeat protein
MPAADRSFALLEMGGNLLPGFESVPVAGRILHPLILQQKVNSGELAIKGMPFLPVDYRRHSPQAELMQVFGWMLLIAVPALADWTDYYRSGEELLEQGRPESAIRELRPALAESPDHPAILDALGRAEFRAGRYRSAREHFDQASRVAKKDRAAVLTNSAMASVALGDNRRAESLVRQALELEPQNVTVLKVLAQALYLQKRSSEAKVTLQKILAIQSDPVTKGDLATLYQAEHKNEMAMALLRQAVSEITPGQARARLLTNLGVLQWESGMRERSEKTLRDALEEAEASVGADHPDTARILEQYSEVLRRTGRKAEAKKAAQRAVAIRASSASQANENGFTVDWRDIPQR